MAIPRKKIKKMTPEEALKLTDDEVMRKLLGKKVLAKLKREIKEADAKKAKKKKPKK